MVATEGNDFWRVRAIAFENQKIIMEVQEEIISSWWVQGKALLKMCGVSQKRMRSIRARRTDLCPAGALFG
ncbi:hypothetical protein, partial [Candidatus Magnetaquicoccus inordinatus]|uniref:hypothetical protein n=1 Tax=Candidatus Magnetaquicoccus inordinatus TaxID=2496818 RepID=UPI00102AF956